MLIQDLYDIKELFNRLAKGNESAFEIVFELYKKRVFSVALKMLKSEIEAEEIVQEVFLSIWHAKARLDDINDPEAYLFTITYNTIYTHLKKASRNRQVLDAIIFNLSEIQNTTGDTIAGNETGKLIKEAIERLSPQQRTVYELSKQDGLSYDQIAEQMNISRNTVRNHLAEAMKTIRIFLKKTDMLFMSSILFLVN
jgi:RNA polymerase sigma-70 factor (family 1)